MQPYPEITQKKQRAIWLLENCIQAAYICPSLFGAETLPAETIPIEALEIFYSKHAQDYLFQVHAQDYLFQVKDQ